MERRSFLGTLAGGLLTAPLAGAQQAEKVYRVGFLSPLVGEDRMLGRLLQGLRDLGYVEGRTLIIEQRYAAGRREALPSLSRSWPVSR